MPLTVHQFPCLSDNYGFLIRDEASGKTACIDTPDAGAILRELETLGWDLDFILNTHWRRRRQRRRQGDHRVFDRRSAGSHPHRAPRPGG